MSPASLVNGDHQSLPWYEQAPTDHLALHLLTGSTAAVTCIAYPFTSYYLYLPTGHPLSKQKIGQRPQGPDTTTLPVVVVVHGSGRDAEAERTRWKTFGEEHGCVILSPLFPIDVTSLEGLDNYKRLIYTPSGASKPVYYDQILLQMLQEVSDTWGCIDISKFSLTGFSGGGQFAHRFFYLHPDRMRSVSIGAPGNATLLDDTQPWPLGIKDVPDLFGGASISAEQLSKVPVQLFVGSADTYHTVGFDGTRAELSRFGVLERLHRNLQEKNIEHRFDVEPGVAHRGDLLLHFVQPFVFEQLPSKKPRVNGSHPNGLSK